MNYDGVCKAAPGKASWSSNIDKQNRTETFPIFVLRLHKPFCHVEAQLEQKLPQTTFCHLWPRAANILSLSKRQIM